MVSVIIPVFNCEKFLSKCLLSVINQTFSDLEIICIDDASTDNSSSILSDFACKDKRIKITTFKVNIGAAGARNEGIKEATGEYLYFLDADDWIDSDYIEKMVTAIEETGVNIVVNGGICLEQYSDSSFISKPFSKFWFKGFVNNSVNNTRENIANVFWTVWDRIHRTAFIKENNITFPDNCPITEDMVFHYKCFLSTDKFGFIQGPYYHYVDHPASVSKKYDKGIYHIKAFARIADFIKSNGLNNLKVKLFEVMPSFNISDSKSYEKYKSFFIQYGSMIEAHKDLYTDIDLFFMRSLLETDNFDDYQAKYYSNALMNYLRNKIRIKNE